MTAPPSREAVVADLASVLVADPADVLLDDDLTDHGLDSVRLMTLLERWRAAGWHVEFAAVAVRPTLRTCLEQLGSPA